MAADAIEAPHARRSIAPAIAGYGWNDRRIAADITGEERVTRRDHRRVEMSRATVGDDGHLQVYSSSRSSVPCVCNGATGILEMRLSQRLIKAATRT